VVELRSSPAGGSVQGPWIQGVRPRPMFSSSLHLLRLLSKPAGVAFPGRDGLCHLLLLRPCWWCAAATMPDRIDGVA